MNADEILKKWDEAAKREAKSAAEFMTLGRLHQQARRVRALIAALRPYVDEAGWCKTSDRVIEEAERSDG